MLDRSTGIPLTGFTVARTRTEKPATLAGAKKAPPVPAISPPITLEVLGTPAPKGSSQAFAFAKPGGGFGARVVPGGAKSTREKIIGWDGAVRDAAYTAIGERTSPPFVAVPLEVEIVFRLTRPAGHYGSGRNAGTLKASAPAYPCGKPDIDKLARTTLDSMTGAIFDDDSRIARLTLDKEYATPGREGARIRIAAKGVRPTLAAVPLRIALVPNDDGGGESDAYLAGIVAGTELMGAADNLADHEPRCPCVHCIAARETGESFGKIIAAAGPTPSQERIRKILAGTTVEADSALLKSGKRSHALERHLPAPVVDEDDFGGPDL